MAQAGLTAAKAEHDAHLRDMPEGAFHDALACPLCAIDDTQQHGGSTNGREARMGEAVTYSEDELAARVTAAVAPLEEQIRNFQDAQASSEVAEQINAAKAPLEAKVVELEGALDTATARAETAEKQLTDTRDWLQAEADAAKAAEEIAERRESRVAAARELVSFSDEYVEAHAERWAEMPDEAWTATLDGWREIAQAQSQGERPPTSEIPRETALHAGRENGGKSTSAARDVVRMRRSGINVRTLTR